MLQRITGRLVPATTVDRDTVIVAPVLPHGWAWPARHVRVTADRADMGRASGEVVLERVRAASRGGATAVRGSRRETASGEATIFVALGPPVNGVHAVLELLGATELPLAEDSPENEDTTNGGDNSNQDGDDVAADLGCSGQLRQDGCGSLDGGDHGLCGLDLVDLCLDHCSSRSRGGLGRLLRGGGGGGGGRGRGLGGGCGG